MNKHYWKVTVTFEVNDPDIKSQLDIDAAIQEWFEPFAEYEQIGKLRYETEKVVLKVKK